MLRNTIVISGSDTSGKTWLAAKLATALPQWFAGQPEIEWRISTSNVEQEAEVPWVRIETGKPDGTFPTETVPLDALQGLRERRKLWGLERKEGALLTIIDELAASATTDEQRKQLLAMKEIVSKD